MVGVFGRKKELAVTGSAGEADSHNRHLQQPHNQLMNDQEAKNQIEKGSKVLKCTTRWLRQLQAKKGSNHQHGSVAFAAKPSPLATTEKPLHKRSAGTTGLKSVAFTESSLLFNEGNPRTTRPSPDSVLSALGEVAYEDPLTLRLLLLQRLNREQEPPGSATSCSMEEETGGENDVPPFNGLYDSLAPGGVLVRKATGRVVLVRRNRLVVP